MADAWRYEDRYPDTDIYYDCVEDLDLESLRCAIADLCCAMTQVITRCNGLRVARLTEYPSTPPPSPPTLVFPPSPPPVVLFEGKGRGRRRPPTLVFPPSPPPVVLFETTWPQARKAARKAARKTERKRWTEIVATNKAVAAAGLIFDAAFPACKSDDDDFPFSLFY